MSYAQRPMGDYKTYGYAGDPGWLSRIWRGARTIIRRVAGVVTSPIGQVITGAGAVVAAAPQVVGPPRAPTPPPGTIGGAVAFPGGVTVSGAVVPRVGPGAVAAGACPTGYHLDKATGTRWVRNRRMNIANPKALRKAMRRVQGFEKLAKRTISFTRRVKMKR